MKPSPPWLAEFQRHFSQVLMTPLQTSTGTFRPELSQYDETLRADVLDSSHGPSGAALTVYNRQVWFRFFTAMQEAFPLVARLVGLYPFNHLAQRYLSQYPPNYHDLNRIGGRFAEWFIGAGEGVSLPIPIKGLPTRLLVEAVRIDDAWKRVALSCAERPWRAADEAPMALTARRLRLRSSVALVEESWALLELRRRAISDPGEGQLPPPAALAESRTVAVVRVADGLVEQTLPPLARHLIEALATMTVGEALQLIEDRYGALGPEVLAREVQWTFARTSELGFWRSPD